MSTKKLTYLSVVSSRILTLLTALLALQSSLGDPDSCPLREDQCTIMSESRAREVVRRQLSLEQAEGEGALVRRSVGRPEVGPFEFVVSISSYLLIASCDSWTPFCF